MSRKDLADAWKLIKPIMLVWTTALWVLMVVPEFFEIETLEGIMLDLPFYLMSLVFVAFCWIGYFATNAVMMWVFWAAAISTTFWIGFG